MSISHVYYIFRNMEPRWSLVQVLVDALMLLVVGLPTPLIKNAQLIFQRGFFCDDETIMHPVTGPSTVDNRFFHPVGILTVVGVVLLTEYLRERTCPETINFWRFNIPKWCHKAYTVIVSFAFGFLCCLLVATVLKGAVGRLRPYFLADCAPNINCSLPENQHVYHTDFECTNKNTRLSLRLSFPSGHAHYAMYCAIFLGIYFQKRMVWSVSKLPKSGLQLFFILLALLVGVSRVSDYKHHWMDVVGGFLLGGASAVLVSLNLYCFSPRLKEKCNAVTPEQGILMK